MEDVPKNPENVREQVLARLHKIAQENPGHFKDGFQEEELTEAYIDLFIRFENRQLDSGIFRDYILSHSEEELPRNGTGSGLLSYMGSKIHMTGIVDKQGKEKDRKLKDFREEIERLAKKHPEFFTTEFVLKDLGDKDMDLYRTFQMGSLSLGEAEKKVAESSNLSETNLNQTALVKYIAHEIRQNLLNRR